MACVHLCSTYFGIACVALTPNLLVAAILSGAFYGAGPLQTKILLLLWIAQASCS